MLLQKTLLNIEGIGRHLYGGLDLWATAAPFMQRWRAQKTSFPGLVSELKGMTPDLLQTLPNLPRNLLLAPGRIEMMMPSQRRQSRKITDLALAIEKQTQRQRQQFGLILLSLAAIGLLTAPGVNNEGAPGLIAASLIIGAFGLLQLIKGKG